MTFSVRVLRRIHSANEVFYLIGFSFKCGSGGNGCFGVNNGTTAKVNDIITGLICSTFPTVISVNSFQRIRQVLLDINTCRVYGRSSRKLFFYLFVY